MRLPIGPPAADEVFSTSNPGWVEAGGGQALWDELYQPFGVKPFMAGNTGVCMGGWFGRELKSLADLRGLKLRALGLYRVAPIAAGRIMFLVHNEQTKLSAAWLNTLATALVAAGTFAPFAALLYGLSNPTVGRAVLTFTAIVCFVGGIALHFGGRVLLGRLRE